MAIRAIRVPLQTLLPAAILLLLVGAATRAEEHFFDSDGVKIRYTDEGEGPPVVLVHGYTAKGDTNWRIPGTIAALKGSYRVITLDNRGHGSSDQPTDSADYGPKMVDDVVRLLDHLKIDKAHIVGYSMGGMITLKMATVAPQRMLSAVVGGMGWVKPGAPVPEGASGDRGNAALRACARAFPTLGISREELAAIKLPMVVLIGTKDHLRESRVDPLREVRSDIPVLEIEGANHITCIFRPEFKQAIKDFLDKQPAPAATAAPQK